MIASLGGPCKNRRLLPPRQRGRLVRSFLLQPGKELSAVPEMGWSEMEGRCTRHPSHRLSKGVCPMCLRDRLSQISASSSALSSAGSSYDSISSTIPSSSSSPPHGGAAAKVPLTKSRSLVFFLAAEKKSNKPATREDMKKEDQKTEAGIPEDAEAAAPGEKQTKKRGFWSILANGGRKKREKGALSHSKTVRESSSSRWAFLS